MNSKVNSVIRGTCSFKYSFKWQLHYYGVRAKEEPIMGRFTGLSRPTLQHGMHLLLPPLLLLLKGRVNNPDKLP